MEEIVKQKFPTDNLVFNVYPEVSANIQALRNSPYASINDTRIYVYTDVGSGTVDQCCFTFYSPNKSIDDSNNFFAAKVFPYGSSVIEFLCHNKWPKIGLNTWKQLKEECSNDIRLNTIINILESRLTSEFKNHTLLQLQDHLHDNYSINSKESMRRNIYVVFGGGGCTYLPYKSAVFKALQSYLGLPKDYLEKLSSSWTDRIIYLNIPEDIVLDSEHYNWMKRLYVAYGISFLYDDLPKFKSPNQLFLKKQFFRYSQQKSKNIIDKTINKEEKQICPYCRGQNPNCLYCDGKGVI